MCGHRGRISFQGSLGCYLAAYYFMHISIGIRYKIDKNELIFYFSGLQCHKNVILLSLLHQLILFPLFKRQNEVFWKEQCWDFYLILWKYMHNIPWVEIICLNKYHATLYCLSSDSNISIVYWQLFWKMSNLHGTNEKMWQVKCTDHNECTQFAIGIHMYQLNITERWNMFISPSAFRRASLDMALLKLNRNTMQYQIRRRKFQKVNDRFSKEPQSHEK